MLATRPSAGSYFPLSGPPWLGQLQTALPTSAQECLCAAECRWHQTEKPRLEPLSLLQQVTAIAEHSGWKCQLSEKGQYTIAMAAFFDGFDGLCRALRRQEIAKVLIGYLNGDSDALGLRLSDRRRYLSRSDVDELAGQATNDVLTELTDLRILGWHRAQVLAMSVFRVVQAARDRPIVFV